MSRGLYSLDTSARGRRVGYYDPIDCWFSKGGTYSESMIDSALMAKRTSFCLLGKKWYEERSGEVTHMLLPEEVFNNE